LGQQGTIQIHDFNLGIAPNGLFWSTPSFPTANVSLDLARGTASMRAHDWSINDYTNLANSAGDLVPPIAPIPASVSFDAEWTAIGAPTAINDSTNGFRGVYRNSSATLAWSAHEPVAHFRFDSAAASTSTTVSGVIGREFNGKFY